MHIKYVASNAKGGISCVLGEKTLIVGPNGSGKSGVINSVELALTGTASDLFGRESMSKENELIGQLAPDRKGHLFSRALLSDGTEAKWDAGTKDTKKAVHRYPESAFNPKTVFPIRPLLDAVRGKPDTARKFLISFAAPKLEIGDVLKLIPESLHANFRESYLSAGVNESVIDKLLLALEFSGKKSRDTKGKANAQEEMISVQTDGLPALPTAEIEAAVKESRKQAQKGLESLISRQAAAQSVLKLQQDAEEVRKQLASAESAAAQWQAAEAQASTALAGTPQPKFLDEQVLRVIAVVETIAAREAAAQQPQTCPVCTATPPLGHFQQRNQAGQAFKSAEEAKAAPYNAARDAHAKAQASLMQWKQHIATLRTQLDAIANSLAAGTVTPPTAEEIAAARAKVDEIDAQITKTETLKGAWAQANKTKEAVHDANDEATKWKRLNTACNDAVAKLLDQGVVTFVERVRTFLPQTDNFDLRLRDGAKAVFQFGLKKGDVVHSAMSGAEWARVIAACAAVCADTAHPLSLIIPEERAFDPNTLAATMQAFLNIPGQIIIASPVFPSTLIPGWHIVNTANNEHRTGQPQ